MKKNTTRSFSLGWLPSQCSALLLALVMSSNAYSSCASPFHKDDTKIPGFATDISVNRGSTVRFKVDTPAAAWRLDIHRIGYFGNGMS